MKNQTGKNINIIADFDHCIEWLKESLLTEPFILLIGAGISKAAGLPSAYIFCEKVIDELLQTDIFIEFTRQNSFDFNSIKTELLKIEFDTLLGLLKRSGPEHYPLIFNAFYGGYPNNISQWILKLCSDLPVAAIFTTNFDLVFEKTAELLNVELKVFTKEQEFPDDILPRKPLPIFKLHGGLSNDFDPLDLGADVFDITKDKTSKRGVLFEKYLHTHNLVILGYGGADFWDIYPIIYSEAIKKMYWIDFRESDTISVRTHKDAYDSLVLRDHIDRLLAAWPNRFRIIGDTSRIIRLLYQSFERGNDANWNIEIPSHWLENVSTWVKTRKQAVLVDIGTLLNAVGNIIIGSSALSSYILLCNQGNNDRNLYSLAIAYEGVATNCYQLAQPYFEKAKKIALSIGNKKLLARIMVEEAIFLGNFINRDRAIDLLLEASQIAASVEYEECIAFCMANIGNQYVQKKDYQKSESFYIKAIKYFRKTKNSPQLALTLFNLAQNVYWPSASKDIGIMDKILPLYLECLSLLWGRNILQSVKIRAYCNIIYILRHKFLNQEDVATYIASKYMLQVSGVAEHIIHWISEHGFNSEGLQLEDWKHDMGPFQN